MEEPKKTKKWIKKCFDCGQDKPHHGRGLCGICYTKHKKAGTLPPPLKLALTTDDNLANPCELKHLAPLSPPSVIPAPNPVIPAEAGIHLAPVILIPNITLSFPPADQPLFDSILAEAKRYRRDPDQQILWIVGEALKCGGLD